MKWIFFDGCGFAFGIVAIVLPLEMASPLDMLRNRVGYGAALSCCVAVVALIPTVDFCGSIYEVGCCCRPRLCWEDVIARRVLELPSGFLLVALAAFALCWEVRRG